MSGRAGALALASLIDPVWCARRLPQARRSISLIAEALEQCAPSVVRSAINPLIDLEFIADRYLNGAANLSALEVAVRYASDLLPIGRSPHPLIDRSLFRICHPAVAEHEKSGKIRSWVEVLFNGPDRSALALPFLDPDFVLREMRLSPKDLSTRGTTSVSRLYLGEAAYSGIRPHPLFDPIYVHAKRTNSLPSKGATRDAGSFLIAEFGSYIQQAGKRGRASPSIGFDEDLLRANRHVAGAVRRRRYANAFHAWVVNSERMAGRPLTESGIHAFPSCVTPKVWFKLEKDFSIPRHGGGTGVDAAFLRAARKRLSKQKPPPVHVRIEGDLPHAVRLGQRMSLVVHGYAASPMGRLVGVEIRVGVRKAAGSFQGVPRLDAIAAIGAVCKPDDRLFCGFAIMWHGTTDEVGATTVSVRFRLAGRGRKNLTRWVYAGTITIERPMVRTRTGRPAQVAIAMATYNPKPELFSAQFDSIRAQTLTDWRLVISDESSDERAREAIRRIVANDPRVSLETGPHIGFVGNFERALSRLDRRSPFFTLSDQDDIWYPAKLQTLVAAIEREKAALVYGGMRVVTDDGRLIDPSFFTWRRPHGHSVDELLLANTVTGAATLARMDLLALALPIPRYVSVYHDMWLALVAAGGGRVVHVTEILQDYTQHEGNVLGQSSLRDRASARSFSRGQQCFECFTDCLSGTRYPRANFADLMPQLLTAIGIVWNEAIQREFLSISLAHRCGKTVEGNPLTASKLATASRTRRLAVGVTNPRKFLNIPKWLETGTAALEQATSLRGRVVKMALYPSAASPRKSGQEVFINQSYFEIVLDWEDRGDGTVVARVRVPAV